MRTNADVTVEDVESFYSGDDVDLLELVMGEQLHVGGLDSTLELARLAGVGAGQSGVDLCCCTGAGMRVLVRCCDVGSMVGIDISSTVIERGRDRCERAGLADRITFVEADATKSGLDDESCDFVWSEDAWVYVPDKPALVAEAVRLVRPGGVIAFTDWVEGPTGLEDDEAELLMGSFHFPSLETLDGYAELLAISGCSDVAAEDTGLLGDCAQLFASMLSTTLKYDALETIDFDADRYEAFVNGFGWMASLGKRNKLIQGRFTGRKS